MILDIAYTQHQGTDWRYPVQQDALWSGVEVFQARNLRPACHQTAADVVTLAVADGLGGSPLAERASRTVLEELATAIQGGVTFDKGLVRRIHARLCDRLAFGETIGSATTLAAVQIQGEQCAVMNVGDSRVYRLSSRGEWQQLSRDHTVLNGLIARGEAAEGEEYATVYNTLDSCLAADSEEADFDIHQCAAPFLPGDALLLCTDGVHDTLDSASLQQLIVPGTSALAQAQILRKAVIRVGAPDNFSLIFIASNAVAC
ncbi:MAG: PP2C family protein-serine/threonine phosphatase [Acidovorax defluvii]